MSQLEADICMGGLIKTINDNSVIDMNRLNGST